MKRFISIIAIVLVVSSAAFAEPSVNPKTRAAVKELMEVIDFKHNVTQIMQEIGKQLPQMIQSQLEVHAETQKWSPLKRTKLKSLSESVGKKGAKKLVALFSDKEFVQELEDVIVRSYTKHFDETEIKALTDFYKTAVGKKFLAVTPQLTAENMSGIMSSMAPRLAKMQESIVKEELALLDK